MKHLFSMKTCLEVGSRGEITHGLCIFGFLLFHGIPKMHIERTKIAHRPSVLSEMGSPEYQKKPMVYVHILVFWLFPGFLVFRLEKRPFPKGSQIFWCECRIWSSAPFPRTVYSAVRSLGCIMDLGQEEGGRERQTVFGGVAILGFWVFPPKWHKPCLSW